MSGYFSLRIVDQIVLASPFLAAKQKENMQSEGSVRARAGSCALGRMFIDWRSHREGRKLVIFKFFFSQPEVIDNLIGAEEDE